MKQVLVSKEWKRYWVSCLVPETGWDRGFRDEVGIMVSHLGPGGTAIWIDAAQFEPGKEPTEYSP